MKKILLITENLGSGGAERQICGLASMLKNIKVKRLTEADNSKSAMYNFSDILNEHFNFFSRISRF